MSLNAALQIGRSALNASQLGIQIAGNNLANAATPGYSRQVGALVPVRGDRTGMGGGVGNGVAVQSVRRQIDDALQSRLMSSDSDRSAAETQHGILSQVETVLGELGDNDLSSELSAFFRSWSERANQTKSSAAVIQQGDKLAGFIRRLRSDLSDQRTRIDDQLGATVSKANELLRTIGNLNETISTSEGGGATANPLRDQRDQALRDLSQIMDVSVVDRGLGGVDILVGSAPVLQGSRVHELELKRINEGSTTRVAIATRDSGTQTGEELSISSGTMAALLDSRTSAVNGTIDRLDALASQLIFEVNKVHSTATNAAGLTSSTGTLNIATADRTLAFNDSANETFSGLPFAAVHGGFTINVKDTASGAVQSVRINVDLDGINASGAAGTQDDTTPESLRAALDAVSGIKASFTPDGTLKVEADAGQEFSFSDDTSHVLAVVGLNSYFTGKTGADIGVRADLKQEPLRLSVGQLGPNGLVENGAALALSGLQTKALDALGGQSITGHWRDAAQAVGAAVSAAKTNAESKGLVNDSLEAQRSAVSGVNIDEESIGLLDYQRQYQAAARVISTVDQMMQTLMTIV